MSERNQRLGFRGGLLAAILVVTTIGCGNNGGKTANAPPPRPAEPTRPQAPQAPQAPQRPEEPVAPSAPNSPATFTVVDPAGLAKAIDKHAGKVVLVDFWSTTCIPCIHGLPKMAELRRKLGDKGFVVITIAMDDKQEDETNDAFQSRLLSALGNSQTEFTNLLSKLGGEEEAMTAFDVDGGALPHYRLFGRDGKLIRKFVSGDPDAVWDHTDVVAAVEGTVGK